MAEPLLSTGEQPRLNASDAINKDQLGRLHSFGRSDRLPVVWSNFDIEHDGVVRRPLLDLIERQLRPAVDLPWVELYEQIAKERHWSLSNRFPEGIIQSTTASSRSERPASLCSIA